VTSRIFGDDGDGILGSNSGCLAEDAVSNSTFNILDFLDRLLFVESINEKINIGSRGKDLVVIVAKRTL
jgi:hypothetical protein